MPRTATAALTLALLVITSSGASAAHPHYERLFRQGTYALEQGDHGAAARDLRLACFGMLEEPEALARCLAHLGLAQTGIGDDEGFRETFRRLVTLEERFRAYSAADLPTETRSSLEAAVRETVPAATLQRSAGFDHLAEAVEPPAQPPDEAAGEPNPVPKGAEAAPEPEPRPTQEEPPTESPEPEPSSREAPSDVQSGTDEGGPDGSVDRLSAEDRRTLERARTLLDRATSRGELEEPLRLATGVADRHPGSSEAQHLAATIAYRASRFEQAVRYFRRGGDPGEEEPQLLFYLAVSLYESGELQEAAEAFRRSLPHLERTPFVRSYQEKILGQDGDNAPDGTP